MVHIWRHGVVTKESVSKWECSQHRYAHVNRIVTCIQITQVTHYQVTRLQVYTCIQAIHSQWDMATIPKFLFNCENLLSIWQDQESWVCQTYLKSSSILWNWRASPYASTCSKLLCVVIMSTLELSAYMATELWMIRWKSLSKLWCPSNKVKYWWVDWYWDVVTWNLVT